MVKAFKITVAGGAMAMAALLLTTPAQAGNSSAVGAGLAGFGIGAILGGALAPREVYVVPPPPPPPPVYYGPVAYGPPPWTPGWYDYCARRYPGFDPQTGYFVGPDGAPHFCLDLAFASKSGALRGRYTQDPKLSATGGKTIN
jgi:hypothetical protein